MKFKKLWIAVCTLIFVMFTYAGLYCMKGYALQDHNIVILTYHQLVPSHIKKWNNDPYVMPVAEFIHQMDLIKASGYKVVSFKRHPRPSR